MRSEEHFKTRQGVKMSASQDSGRTFAASSEQLDDLQNEVKLLREQMQLVLNRLPPERRKYSRGKLSVVAETFTQCQLAIALLLSGESKLAVIAEKIGVHRHTLNVSDEFAPFRQTIGTLRNMRQFARTDGRSRLDSED